jgi:5-methyltetrahydropteroyltriglutamate--homocysteine methyltransferase
MKRSVDRILTTHTGSLPRPPRLLPLLFDNEFGRADRAVLDDAVRESVDDVVRQQADVGLDVINDGEMGKISYAAYIKDRLTGFDGVGMMPVIGDSLDFPSYAARVHQGAEEALKRRRVAACDGPIGVKDRRLIDRDIATLRAAVAGVHVQETFLTAASPGVIALFFVNQHYGTREAYLAAIADAMQVEYEATAAAGFVLQVDCPDLAMGRHLQFNDASVEEFRGQARLNVEALNHATRNIPPDQMRMHICWGNYEGPHHRDVALRDIIDIVFRARPSAISIEACNPRHEHEWKLFEEVRLPDDKLLIPGVIDSTNNYIEHPELVAQRIQRYTYLLGQHNVLAGSDCGFSTGAGTALVDPTIAWAKLRVLAEGARLASETTPPRPR